MDDSTLTLLLVGALVVILLIAGAASLALAGKPRQ
jgi:hypothetical protein